jgi:hypothetical protein
MYNYLVCFDLKQNKQMPLFKEKEWEGVYSKISDTKKDLLGLCVVEHTCKSYLLKR